MKWSVLFRGTMAALAGAAALLSFALPSAHAQVTLLDSFTPGVGPLIGIGFDPVSGNLYVYPDFSDAILRYTQAGVQVNPDIPNPGASSNDYDLDFAPEAFNLGGTVVPANTLLVIDGEVAPSDLYGVDPTTGAVLDSQVLTPQQLVGGAYHAGRDTFFGLAWSSDQILEINPADGALLTSFSVVPGGSPPYDVFFGDLDVYQPSGNLFLVSDAQNIIRELTPTGAFVQDINVGPLGISGMAGIAINDAAGEAWISSTNGTVYRVGGLFGPASTAAPEPATLALFGAALLPLAGIAHRRRLAKGK